MRILLVFVLSLGNTSYVLAKTEYSNSSLTLCYENFGQPPYFFPPKSSSDTELGLLPAKIRKATQETNIRVEFTNKPWNRCISMLKKGEVDGVFPIIWTKERDSWGVFPKQGSTIDGGARLHRAIYKIFTHHHSMISWNGREFHGLRQGLSSPMGYIISAQLKRLRASNQFQHSPEIGFELLSKGRLDGYIIEERVGKYFLSSGPHPDLKVLDSSFLEADWHVAFSTQWFNDNKTVALKIWRNLMLDNNNE